MGTFDADLRVVEIAADAGLETWLSVYNAAWPERPLGSDYVRHVWNVAPEWTAVVVERNGEPAGAAQMEVPHWMPGARHVDVILGVHPDHGGVGVGTALYRAASTWAEQRSAEALHVFVDEHRADAVGFWLRRGFVEVGRDQVSRLELSEHPEPVVVPADIVLVTLAQRPDLELGMYRVGVEAVADVPGPEPYEAGDFEHWRAGELRVPGLVEECTVIALSGDEVVGFAVVVEVEARPGVAMNEFTGVLRAWRGRGIARAMKLDVLRRAHRRGLRALEAENEVRNEVMLAINRRLGFVPQPATLTLRGPLTR